MQEQDGKPPVDIRPYLQDVRNAFDFRNRDQLERALDLIKEKYEDALRRRN